MDFSWIIVIGTSAGGLPALQTLVSGLPADFPAAVLIIQHQAPDSPGLLSSILSRCCKLPVSIAGNGDPIKAGHIYVAPPDHHLLVEQDCTILSRGPRENLSRPAIDPLFRSAALAYRSRVIGVILTGRLDDGTAGLAAVKALGGITIVQDPTDALYPAMPRNALAHVQVDHQRPISTLAPLLVSLTREPVPTREGERVDEKLERELELETKIVKGGRGLQNGVMTLGPTTPFTCPECHGVLVQIKQGGAPRFRCHTGHAYTFQSLLLDVGDYIEEALWNTLRAVEESIMLVQHAVDHSGGEHGLDDSLRIILDQHIHMNNRRVELVRQALLLE